MLNLCIQIYSCSDIDELVFCLLFLFVQRCDGNEFIRQKPAADLAIFGGRSDRPKSPGVPGGAIAIFADRRFKQCARWCARPRIR